MFGEFAVLLNEKFFLLAHKFALLLLQKELCKRHAERVAKVRERVEARQGICLLREERRHRRLRQFRFKREAICAPPPLIPQFFNSFNDVHNIIIIKIPLTK